MVIVTNANRSQVQNLEEYREPLLYRIRIFT